MDTINNISYTDYLSFGFIPLRCKGHHPKYNPTKDYKTAKEPVSSGWTLPEYQPPSLKEIEASEKKGGWTGWLIPKEMIVLDVEDADGIASIKEICRVQGLAPAIHKTNNGVHFFFVTSLDLSAASKVFTKYGIEVTYRVGGKNYLILAPINNRSWESWITPDQLPILPDDFLPYNRKSIDEVLNCLAWQVSQAYRSGHFSGYEDLDAAFMAYLIECKLSQDQVHHAFEIVFAEDYDERRTETMYVRTKSLMEAGQPVIGAGSFMQRVKEQGLKEIERFARELQTATTSSRVWANEDWPDPIPFDEYSSLPDFPIDALSGIGRDIVGAVSEVNQVDPALTACIYLAVLSTCCSKKTKVDLISHHEPVNLYLCPVYDSGNRKSTTVSDMVKPLYEFEKDRQVKMEAVIRDAQNAFKIKEKRLERLQKKAADEEDQNQRRQLENEAAMLLLDIANNTVPKTPIYLIDDVTPEKLGVVMAENGERIAAIHPEGNLFEIMAGRYSKDGNSNLDLFLKAHAGDYWSNHRIGREAKTMSSPALTLCLAVQSAVIEEAGKNQQFRGKGLLARFLYARCKSQVGYRERQIKSLNLTLCNTYRTHIFSLMDVPFMETDVRLSPEAQTVWNEFYDDIEREMRPGQSLQYLVDWGSKLAGATARIAGLLHLAEYGAKGLSLPISVNFVSASCVIGSYFKEHALAVFGMMQEDKRIKLARQILNYLERQRPETFKGRDVMHHTNICLMDEVEQGLKVLIDRGYVREEMAGWNRESNPGPGRPSAKTYRVNPKVLEDRNT